MVGDRSSDVEAVRGAGCTTVCADLCYEEPAPDTPNYVVHCFLDVGHGLIGKASTRAFSAVVWHCLVSHPALQRRQTNR